jgi:serine/threonine protein kinase
MGVPHTGPGVPGPAFEPSAADDPAAVSGHRIAGRLGVSALGRVHLAHAPGGQPVTLTVVRPELAEREGFQARFHRDAQAAGRVHAPSVVPVLGSGREGTRYWVASAYVPAVTLRAAVTGPLAGAGPLPTRVVLRLVAGLAEGLRALQDAGVAHGDLRPAHVLLAADGPRLKEYGFSGLPGFTPQDGEGPAFLAPEQAAGHPATAATDVFALGQIAAYASIGVPPFGDVPSRVRQEEPDLNELPGELREIVTRCLIKDPALRPSLAQIATMCAQAAPVVRPPHAPSAWLPPHLLTAHYPPPAPTTPPASPAPMVVTPAEAAAPTPAPVPPALQVFKGPRPETPPAAGMGARDAAAPPAGAPQGPAPPGQASATASGVPTLLLGLSEPFVGLAHPGVPGVAFRRLPWLWLPPIRRPAPHDDSAAH